MTHLRAVPRLAGPGHGLAVVAQTVRPEVRLHVVVITSVLPVVVATLSDGAVSPRGAPSCRIAAP